MRDLNEIVIVKHFIECEISRAERDGYELTYHMIAGRAAAAMGITQDAAYTQLMRNLNEGRNWTVNYLQGFAAAVGKTHHEFIMVQGDGSRPIPDATVAQCLFTALNHRMGSKTSRALIASLQRQLDFPPMFDFLQLLSARLLDADSGGSALKVAVSLVNETNVFDLPRQDLRGKKKNRQKVQIALDAGRHIVYYPLI